MPGYVLHLAAASLAANVMGLTPEERKRFYVGSLIPDAVKDKTYSHFRNPNHAANKIEYPDLSLFLDRYGSLLKTPAGLGYAFHLYTDRRFFKEFLPSVVELLNQDLKPEMRKELVCYAKVRKSGELLPVNEFFSRKWYYGDFTKMNTWLVRLFDLPVEGEWSSCENPGFAEVDFEKIHDIIRELQGYMGMPEEAALEVKVFEREALLAFLRETAEGFAGEYYEKNRCI